jgi:hypothetical protein
VDGRNTAKLTNRPIDSTTQATTAPYGSVVACCPSVVNRARNFPGGGNESSSVPRHTDTVAAEFTCTRCDAAPELVVDGKAQIAIVRHELGCPTLLAQTRTRWPVARAGGRGGSVLA